jgi:hypothetical protein
VSSDCASERIRGQVLAEAHAAENGFRVGLGDFARRLAGIEGEQDGDEPTHDVRVAIAPESEHRLAVPRGLLDQPDLARAAAHLVFVVVLGRRQRRERLAELDDIAIAVLPIVEEAEILNQILNRRGCHGSATVNIGGKPGGWRKASRREKPRSRMA